MAHSQRYFPVHKNIKVLILLLLLMLSYLYFMSVGRLPLHLEKLQVCHKVSNNYLMQCFLKLRMIKVEDRQSTRDCISW